MPHKSKQHKPMKGTPGKGTGATARKAIRAAEKRGCTQAQIGTAAKRSASTISGIKSGTIRNPPRNLAANVRKSKCGKRK